MPTYYFLIFLVSLFLLYRGAAYIIDSTSKLAANLGVTPIVIALSVVAIGTSAPELITAITAAIDSKPDLIMGNVVGSNIANIALIIASAALIHSIKVSSKVLKRQIPFLLGATLLLFIFSLDGLISRLEGLTFIGLAIAFLFFLIRQATKERVFDEAVAKVKATIERKHKIYDSLLIIFGIAMLIIGAKFLVVSASAIALSMGVTQAVIGITIIALGTSLPELVTSIVASFKRHNEIIIGTIIGSSILNIFLILGVTASLIPVSVNQTILRIDAPIMLLIIFVFVTIMRTNYKISRVEGFVLMIGYISYIFYVLTRA